MSRVAERLAVLAEPRQEAEYLLGAMLAVPRTRLHAFPEEPVPADQAQEILALAARRAAGEPLAYLIGWCGFGDLELRVGRDVLIPRPETELLVEQALAALPEGACRVADLGTGSGAVALAIARARPDALVVGTDRARPALAVAEANGAALQLANVAWLAGDWLAPLAGGHDLIVSNPPYIPDGDPHLAGDGVRFEPRGALAAGPDGLDALRRIIADAPSRLVPGGQLLLEHGHDQGAAVRGLLAQAGFADIMTHRDLAGCERVSGGRLPAAGQAIADSAAQGRAAQAAGAR